MSRAEHESWMREALAEARRGWGDTHPNPMVGALIVEDGRAVAVGHHARAGGPHAEIAALNALGRKPWEGATLYVTLEPCSTQGRTPPCTEAIIASGIRRVVAGATDPNPSHAGRGFNILREFGIDVMTGVLADECEDLNLIFNHWITKGRPLVAAKVATSLDGRIAARSGESKWITGEAARADVMRWRRLFPAIAVGSGTVATDDPQLTVRAAGTETCPARFIFDGSLGTAALNPAPRVISDAHAARTTFVTLDSADPIAVASLEENGVRVWRLPGVDGEVDFDAFLARCAEENLTGVLVEGGSRTISGLLRQRRIDYLLSYRAPILFADAMAVPMATGLAIDSPGDAIRLERVRHATFGDDQMIRGFLHYPEVLPPDDAAIEHERRHGHR
ncbi:MAG TPA: bifunctional diaminohydroxyphosphoribosylaminopyrimidine deaminase/5-amino-6-(5-phosphoribosylamino)uracil reductase RibD [Opitutaceae bacterium]|nr:bifunctional diaminohydroxyphosphoribosylaminopyrimidine deaminase/5-amino-6-(5-phosphoribosylamino)uracil reductase RibD [Opitutaceae bacterium]